MVVRFIILLQTLLLGVTCLQVLQGMCARNSSTGDDPSVLWQAEQSGLLCIDDGFLAANVSLECPHLRCLKGEPQSELALAKRASASFRWVMSMTVPIERTACRPLAVSR